MAAKPTKLYPVRDRFLIGEPRAVRVVDTKEEADRLVATGAFTDNPNASDRDKDVPDLTAPVKEPEQTPDPGTAPAAA